MEFFRKLFQSDFMPHGHCYFWKPDVLWTNVAGDFIIALAYYLIPFALYYYTTRKEGIAFKPVFLLFALFILSCGTTHILDIISVWHPVYRFEGLLKLLTGAISMATAVVLIKIIPDALQLPSITQLKTIYKQLRHQNMALQRVAYATSHNMKEPIRGLTIYAQRIKSKYGDSLPQDAKDDLNYMVEEGNRMYEIIDSLMNYAFITPENFPMTRVEILTVLQKVESGLKLSIADAGAEIRYGKMPTVKGNEDLLVLLFQKLVNNSIRFKSNTPPTIEISCEDREGTVLLTYKDNSIGFAPEYESQVFDMFVKVHTEASIRSTGMGLAISRRIVDIHGGSIAIHSKQGKGVRFEILLNK